MSDYIKLKKGVELNKRYSGEYIDYGGLLWRIIESSSDGTTKVICDQNLFEGDDYLTFEEPEGLKQHIYNPNQKTYSY